MVHQDPKKTDKQVQAQDDQIYGEEQPSGSDPRSGSALSANTDDMMQAVTGNTPSGDDHIAQEVAKDELDRRTTAPIQQEKSNEPPPDSISEDIDSEEITSQAGASENMVEATEDPFEALTDADLGIKAPK